MLLQAWKPAVGEVTMVSFLSCWDTAVPPVEPLSFMSLELAQPRTNQVERVSFMLLVQLQAGVSSLWVLLCSVAGYFSPPAVAFFSGTSSMWRCLEVMTLPPPHCSCPWLLVCCDVQTFLLLRPLSFQEVQRQIFEMPTGLHPILAESTPSLHKNCPFLLSVVKQLLPMQLPLWFGCGLTPSVSYAGGLVSSVIMLKGGEQLER